MKKLLFIGLLLLFQFDYLIAQKLQKYETTSHFSELIGKRAKVVIKEAGQVGSIEEEAAYYAPIRYVIIYNKIVPMYERDGDRRIKILIDEKSFTLIKLIGVVEHISKKFPSPSDLSIEIHTSLASIETPEENEMVKDGEDSRFSKTYNLYKSAYYNRSEKGKESLLISFPDK